MRDEGHCGDECGLVGAPAARQNFRAWCGMKGFDITHCNRAIERAAETTGGDDAYLRPAGREDVSAFAYWRATRRADADPRALRPVRKLIPDALRAQES